LSAFGLALDLLVCGSDTSFPTYKRHQTPHADAISANHLVGFRRPF
jgi:hypothetical protein